MALDLSTYSSIANALFVKINTYDIDGLDEVITFSDHHKTLTLDGTAYTGLGQLLSITNTQSDLRITPQQISIGISGIPSSNITTVFDSQLKGSKITISRAIFNPTTGELLSITGNPAGRFIGLIDNFSITDEADISTKSGTVTIVFTCASIVGLLSRKSTGRETNPATQKSLYTGDVSFDRIPNLANANFNFGGNE